MKKYLFILFLAISFTLLFPEEVDLENLYKNAKAKIEQNDFKQAFQDIFIKYPDTYYGQLSLLELAKIELLKRNYEQAIIYLKKIYNPDVETKQYWLAKCYLKSENYDSAIISAQNYIFDSENKEKIETAYFIIIEAYIQQNMFKRALNTLEFLRNSEFINNNIPLLHFKIGYCNEKIKKYEEALKSYQKLKIDFPYHHYSYLAEDRIFNLTRNEKFKIAPSNIQPNNKIDQEKKLRKFLQVGAFSTRKNAQKHASDIKNILNHSYIVFEKVINGKNLFIVAFGPYENDKNLNKAKQTLGKKGINSFLIQKYI